MTIPLFRFHVRFIAIFLLLYGINLLCIGLAQPGGWYIAVIAGHFDYISAWRRLLLTGTAFILQLLGHQAIVQYTTLHVTGKHAITLSYSCIGYNTAGFLGAFVIAWPCHLKKKIRMLLPGLFLLQVANIFRLVLLALNGRPLWGIDPHLAYNLIIYSLILFALRKWTGPGMEIID